MNTVKKISVLIADKEPDARELIKETVLSIFKNALVIEASDGTKAEFKTANQNFDLVIAAVNMPGKDGIQLLKVFSQMDKKVRPKSAILLTDGTFDEKWRELFEPLYGVAKPFEAEALKTLIVSALHAAKIMLAPSSPT